MTGKIEGIAGVLIWTEAARFEAMARFYRDRLGLTPRTSKPDFINFDWGGVRLSVSVHDRVGGRATTVPHHGEPGRRRYPRRARAARGRGRDLHAPAGGGGLGRSGRFVPRPRRQSDPAHAAPRLTRPRRHFGVHCGSAVKSPSTRPIWYARKSPTPRLTRPAASPRYRLMIANRARGVGERQRDHGRDQHHPHHGAEAEEEEIGDRPEGITDRGENQERDRGRAGEPVDEADDKGPQRPDIARCRPAPDRAARAVSWLPRVHGSRLVPVGVRVDVVAVGVRVRVGAAVMGMALVSAVVTRVVRPKRLAMPRRISITATENSMARPSARRDHHVEQDDGAAHQHDGHGVPDAPQAPDQSGAPGAPLPAHDRGDGDHVVGVRRMSHAEEEAQHDHGQAADAGRSLSAPAGLLRDVAPRA